MNPKIEFNDTGFKQVIKELAKMSGKTFDEVLKAEAGRVLQRIIKKTPASGVTQTRKVSLRDKAAAIKKNANRAFRFPSGEGIYTHPQTHRRIFLDVSTFKGGTGEKSQWISAAKQSTRWTGTGAGATSAGKSTCRLRSRSNLLLLMLLAEFQ